MYKLFLAGVFAIICCLSVSNEAHAAEDFNYAATTKVPTFLYKKHPGSGRITAVPKGAHVTFHYTASDSWGRVTYNGKKGYILTAYLEIDDKGASAATYAVDQTKLYKYKVMANSMFERIHTPTNSRPADGTKYPYTSYAWYDMATGAWQLDPIKYHQEPLDQYKLVQTQYELLLYPSMNGRFLRSYQLLAFAAIPNARFWDIPKSSAERRAITAKMQLLATKKVKAGTFKNVMKVTYSNRNILYIAPGAGVIQEYREKIKVRELMSITKNTQLK